MRHSIAARYSTRPVARFVRSSSRAGERRLGLDRAGAIRPARGIPTFLTGPDLPLGGRLRRTGATTYRPTRADDGISRIAPAVRIEWTRPGARRPALRTGAASASWRG
ncbi:MAG: hypothetical protein WCH74_06285 [Chloroflexota bacterium]